MYGKQQPKAEIDGAIRIRFEDLIPDREVAEQLGVTTKTIKNRIAGGIFPMPVRLPGSSRAYFVRQELDAWVAEHVAQRPPIGEDPRGGQRKGRKSKAQSRAERLAGGGS